MTYGPSQSIIIQFTTGDVISRTLTISSAIGGTTFPIAGAYQHNSNEQVTITATPDPSYAFSHWVVNGVNNAVNPLVFNIISDTTVSPVFTTGTKPPNNNLLIAAVVAGAAAIGAGAYYATKKKKGQKK